MFTFVTFTIGYMLGGLSALLTLGLVAAARRGDQIRAAVLPIEKRV